ncbi:MAG: phosphate uptake regulator PhoU, partial [Nitrosarchaeum sp.]|nr:phosphate uptake regulator PhoU [Nitrosarchaeum sp.]
MALRKVIGLGRSTLSVTLPKRWTTQHGINKGDYISLEYVEGGDLRIGPGTSSSRTMDECLIPASKATLEQLRRAIIAAYIKDSDRIILVSPKEEYRTELRALFHGLIGLEVIEESSRHMIARTFLSTQNVSLPTTLRRIQYHIKQQFQSVSALLQGEDLPSKPIMDYDKEINKHAFYLIKMIVHGTRRPEFYEQLGISVFEAMLYWHVTECLENIGDALKEDSRSPEPAGCNHQDHEAGGRNDPWACIEPLRPS